MQWLVSEFGFELPQICIDLTFHKVPISETESLSYVCQTEVNNRFKEIELEIILFLSHGHTAYLKAV